MRKERYQARALCEGDTARKEHFGEGILQAHGALTDRSTTIKEYYKRIAH